jgi:3'-phosphoadenosine 5'-phosphosulfate sulfotransferase (PAPS reductase)/FAD synthetase
MGTNSEISDLIARGALFVVNHSGGKDGQAMLIKIAGMVPARQLLVVHASLGRMEWPLALEHAEANATAVAAPFIVAQAAKSLLDMVAHRFATRPEVPSWPSASHRQCTSDLKRGPIEREVRRYAGRHGFSIVVNCLGMRAQESPARARRIAFTRNERNSKAGREWFDWMPIHDMTWLEVVTTIADAGQDMHHAYQLGNERLSCVFCIMASRNDLAIGAQHNPELFEEYRAVEQCTGYTMHQSRRSLEELARAA